MEGNRPLRFLINLRALRVYQLDLLKATISGKLLDVASARWPSKLIWLYLISYLLINEKDIESSEILGRGRIEWLDD